MTRPTATAFLVFALLAAGLYANVLENPFHYDDRHSIEYNKNLHSLGNIPQFFVDPGTFSSERQGTMFRPLLLSSYALNYALHQNWAPGFRIVNLLVHVLCASLLFAIVYSGAGRRREAWAMGLLFLLHPLHGEPINYISSRSDLLVAFFYLLALAISARPWGSWAAYGAALLTKSVAITLPVAIGLWTWIRSGVTGLRARYFAGLLLLSGLYLVAIVANRFLSSSLAKAPRSFDLNLWTQIKALVYYLWLFCMPRVLSVEHPFTEAQGPTDPPVILAGLVVVSLVGLAIFGRRRIEALAFGFFALALMPTTLIPLNILVSERRMYLASVGLIGIAVWAWGRLTARKRRVGLVVGCCVCVMLASMVWMRNPVWASDIALWEDAVAKGPNMFRARANLGLAYAKDERWQEAIAQLEQALKIKGDYADAWVELGNIYHSLGQFDRAERAYRQALEYNPSLEGVYYNLGNMAMDRGEVKEAIRFYGETLTRNSRFTNAYNNLGQAYEKAGDLGEAVRQYRIAVEQDPDFGGAWFNLAVAAERLNQKSIALEAYQRAYKLLASLAEHRMYADRAQQAIERLEDGLEKK